MTDHSDNTSPMSEKVVDEAAPNDEPMETTTEVDAAQPEAVNEEAASPVPKKVNPDEPYLEPETVIEEEAPLEDGEEPVEDGEAPVDKNDEPGELNETRDVNADSPHLEDPHANLDRDNTAIFLAPNHSTMDEAQYSLRIWLILGVFPLPVLGWIIGYLYCLRHKKTKKIHKSLHALMGFLALLCAVAVAIFCAIYFTMHDDDVTDTIDIDTTSSACGYLNIETKTMINKNNIDLMVFTFEGAIPSWKETELFKLASAKGYSVVGVNFSYSKEAKVESDDAYGLKKYASLMGCLNVNRSKRLTLVSVFNKEDATMFKTNPEEDAYYAVLGINSELREFKWATPYHGLNKPKTATHLGYFNTKMDCDGRSAIPAVDATIDGKKHYIRRYPGYGYLYSLFHSNRELEDLMMNLVPLSLNTEEGFKEFELALAEPLKDFMDYHHAILSDGLEHSVMCRRATLS